MTQDLLNSSVLGCIYLLFALGMSLTWGTIGILNFAHGAVFMFSAFSSYLISGVVHLPVVLYVVIAAVVGVVLSVIIQVLVFAPIVRRSSDSHAAETQILIGGIGAASVLVGIAAYVTKSEPFSFRSTDHNRVFEVGGVRITLIGALIIALAVTISLAAAIWIKRSRTGLALRAVAVDPETARLMGVNEPRLAIGTMAVSGLLAGVAGAMLTLHLVTLNPTTGDAFLIKAFAAIVLGGVGSVLGVVVGSFVLAYAENLVTLAGFGSWANAVAFALIFVILLVRPRGLFGRKEVRRT